MDRAEKPGARTVRIAIACSPNAGRAFEVALELPTPVTALDAIRASGLFERHPALATESPLVGIWGRACAPETLLADGDRVEIYRPLTMDPNEARRRRARNLLAAARR